MSKKVNPRMIPTGIMGRAVHEKQPWVIELSPSHIINLVNTARDKAGLDLIPVDATVDITPDVVAIRWEKMHEQRPS